MEQWSGKFRFKHNGFGAGYPHLTRPYPLAVIENKPFFSLRWLHWHKFHMPDCFFHRKSKGRSYLQWKILCYKDKSENKITCLYHSIEKEVWSHDWVSNFSSILLVLFSCLTKSTNILESLSQYHVFYTCMSPQIYNDFFLSSFFSPFFPLFARSHCIDIS